MVVNGKTWKLSIEQLASRREMLGRELDEVAKRRDELRSTQLRAAEVKELIKATELGQEQEELKASIKDIELILEGLHRNVERLSREVLTEETGEPQDALPGVDTSKPPKPPKAPKPSAAARTLALPEHAGPGLTDEAELHEGGPIAPPAPPVHLALPAPRHPDAIEADIVAEVEAEPSEANVQRAIIATLPRDGVWMPEEALAAVLGGPMPTLSMSSIRRCLVDLKATGKVERRPGRGGLFGISWRLVIEAPKAKPSKGKGSKPAPKKAPAKKARGRKAEPTRALRQAEEQASQIALARIP